MARRRAHHDRKEDKSRDQHTDEEEELGGLTVEKAKTSLNHVDELYTRLPNALYVNVELDVWNCWEG